jgi:acetyl esterase/lipase
MRAHSITDVEYSRAGNHSLRMDAAIPDAPGPHPAVIIVHGGGWVAGHRRHNVEMLFRPLTNAGFAWFSISYRLANDVSMFGVAVDDVAQAIDHVHSRAADYRVDPGRLAVIGESAGAHLAMMAVLRAGAATPVSAIVGIALPSDLEALAADSPSVPAGWRTALAEGPWADMLAAVIRGLSPIRHVRPDMPPALLIHGTEDRTVPFSQSERFCRAVREVGARCELHALRGAGHGMRWWSDTRWIGPMVEWLQRATARRVHPSVLLAEGTGS